MRIIKIVSLSLLLFTLIVLSAAYLFLRSSLPELDGHKSTMHLSAQGILARDTLGAAVITAQSKNDAAYLLGYAHAQDRLFQMDLLRKSAAGELSQVVGKVALERDKSARFFQFRSRAEAIAKSLPADQQALLAYYANGVNDFIEEFGSPGFEFILTGSNMAPWQASDTLLVSFSMYIDLQRSQVERDFENTVIKSIFGQQMLDFMYQTSPFQAAIDFSIDKTHSAEIPIIDRDSLLSDELNTLSKVSFTSDTQPDELGSNNWAVSNSLTNSNSAMLSSDMHLGLSVPSIWYRAQMKYQQEGQAVTVTGVSLPGTPLIVAGSTGHIAWGFTNSNVDNVDWVKLNSDAQTTAVSEEILIKDSNAYNYQFEMSEYGPVREFAGQKYALSWVALQPYAINLKVADFPLQKDTDALLAFSKDVGIAVQNMVVADAKGQVAWQLTGAITARNTPSLSAINQADYDVKWVEQEPNPAFVYQPNNHRVWSANARVVGIDDLARYGDGGYALGARQRQILDLLLDDSQFDEAQFNEMQLDNRALFLQPWHNLLTQVLSNNPQKFAQDLEALNTWQACACEDSTGYTLVRRFRSTVTQQLMQPIRAQLTQHDLSLRYSLKLIEGAIWQLLKSKEESWLPKGFVNYDDFLLFAYEVTKDELIEKHGADPETLAGLEWGKVNALNITHPFASSIGPLAPFVNMPVIPAFGDSFMPAVQSKRFGASQRLIVRPGDLDKAILTIPGGQSMHPLSKFYRAGFDEYANGKETPLLPQEIQHELRFSVSL